MEANSNRPQKVTSLQDISKLFSEKESITNLRYNSNSYEIVCLMMYLAGVEKRHFDEHIPALSKQYAAFDDEKTARIIRNLCMLRTALIKNFLNITREILYEMKSLSSMPEYIPPECVSELEKDGIVFWTGGKPDLNNYIIKINQELANRIGSVRPLFPEWIKWDYIKPLFLMPGGTKKNNIKKAADVYNSNRSRYPYRVWLNWEQDDGGNIFAHDYRFISILYEVNGDTFVDKSLIYGTKSEMLVDLYDFIESHNKVLIVVDCENSDPVKLAAALLSLSGSQMSSVDRILFFDSAHTTPAWETLCNTGITKQFDSERKVVSSLYERKSQVDMQLAVDVTKSVYASAVDSVILVSSDSDYWTLIKSLPETDFLVMLEKMKSGTVIRDTLEKQGYQYCFIDDFCTAKAYAIKTDTILNALQRQVDELVHFNIRDMLGNEAKTSWLELSTSEADNLFDRYLKTMRLKVQQDGTVRLIIKP